MCGRTRTRWARPWARRADQQHNSLVRITSHGKGSLVVCTKRSRVPSQRLSRFWPNRADLAQCVESARAVAVCSCGLVVLTEAEPTIRRARSHWNIECFRFMFCSLVRSNRKPQIALGHTRRATHILHRVRQKLHRICSLEDPQIGSFNRIISLKANTPERTGVRSRS